MNFRDPLSELKYILYRPYLVMKTELFTYHTIFKTIKNDYISPADNRKMSCSEINFPTLLHCRFHTNQSLATPAPSVAVCLHAKASQAVLKQEMQARCPLRLYSPHCAAPGVLTRPPAPITGLDSFPPSSYTINSLQRKKGTTLFPHGQLTGSRIFLFF